MISTLKGILHLIETSIKTRYFGRKICRVCWSFTHRHTHTCSSITSCWKKYEFLVGNNGSTWNSALCVNVSVCVCVHCATTSECVSLLLVTWKLSIGRGTESVFFFFPPTTNKRYDPVFHRSVGVSLCADCMSMRCTKT